jgi:hypothetical protein
MLDCPECRRLENLLKEAKVHFYEVAPGVLALADSDGEKVSADMALALRGARDDEDEPQKQFNERHEKRAGAVARLSLAEIPLGCSYRVFG